MWVTHTQASTSHQPRFLGAHVNQDRSENMAPLGDPLRVAFALYVARLIAASDGVIDGSEVKLVKSVIPDKLLAQLHFVDAEGRATPIYEQAYQRALVELPQVLNREEKLQLLTLFHRVGWADGQLTLPEIQVIAEAAELMGLTVGDLRGHLQPHSP